MIKFELKEALLKKIALRHFRLEQRDDDFECYFYLDEAGSPVFVIEELT